MLSGVYSACGCNVELRQRSLFASDARSGMVTCAAVIHAGGSVSAEEIAAMHERPDMAKQRVISVALSDEGERYDISAYNYSRSAWRNYLSDTNPLRRGDVSYLSDAGPSAGSPAQPWGTPGPTTPRLRGAGSGSPEPGSRSPDHESRTFWFPLGYSQMFTSLPTLNLPTRMRALVWSWSGSIGFKPARQQFVDAVFEYSAVNLLDFGTLTTFDYFNDKANQKQPSEFSSLLHMSRIVPCPDGGSPEQFRIWESLEAGAVPIVAAGAKHLGYMDALGFRVLRVRHWRESAEMLHRAIADEVFLAELEEMQAHNTALLARVKSRLRSTFAQEVCQAASDAAAAEGMNY